MEHVLRDVHVRPGSAALGRAIHLPARLPAFPERQTTRAHGAAGPARHASREEAALEHKLQLLLFVLLFDVELLALATSIVTKPLPGPTRPVGHPTAGCRKRRAGARHTSAPVPSECLQVRAAGCGRADVWAGGRAVFCFWVVAGQKRVHSVRKVGGPDGHSARERLL